MKTKLEVAKAFEFTNINVYVFLFFFTLMFGIYVWRTRVIWNLLCGLQFRDSLAITRIESNQGNKWYGMERSDASLFEPET